jgi:Zn-dependent alcohol dehydrogenase
MRGLVYVGDGKAVLSDDLELRRPGPRDVVVRIVAAGLCHTDLSVLDGTIPWPAPAAMGHEGAGVVEEVGESVTLVRPGDHVVVSTIAAGRATPAIRRAVASRSATAPSPSPSRAGRAPTSPPPPRWPSAR